LVFRPDVRLGSARLRFVVLVSGVANVVLHQLTGVLFLAAAVIARWEE
jgi:hypothetical protein